MGHTFRNEKVPSQDAKKQFVTDSTAFVSTALKPDFSHIRSILFDLDGVLMMSNAIHTRAYDLAFLDEDIHDFSHTEISGMRTDEVVRIVLERNHRAVTAAEIARVTHVKREHAKQLFQTDVPVIDGCSAMLRLLKTRFSLALATSASSHTANAFLNFENNREHFDFVICGPEVQLSKPHPEIYLRAMAAVSAQAHHCLVIEDSLHGIEAGLAAGAQVVGVEGTFSPDILRKHGAFEVVGSASHLPALFGVG